MTTDHSHQDSGSPQPNPTLHVGHCFGMPQRVSPLCCPSLWSPGVCPCRLSPPCCVSASLLNPMMNPAYAALLMSGGAAVSAAQTPVGLPLQPPCALGQPLDPSCFLGYTPVRSSVRTSRGTVTRVQLLPVAGRVPNTGIAALPAQGLVAGISGHLKQSADLTPQ